MLMGYSMELVLPDPAKPLEGKAGQKIVTSSCSVLSICTQYCLFALLIEQQIEMKHLEIK